MSALLAGVAACTVLFTMLLARAEHLTGPSALSRALEAHQIVPATATATATATGVVARAAVLAALALLALVRAGATVPLARPGAAVAIVFLAAGVFTLLLWHLPAAMHEPALVHSGRAARRGGMPG